MQKFEIIILTFAGVHWMAENIRAIPYLPHWMVFLMFAQFFFVLYIYLYSRKIVFLPVLSLVDKRVRRELIESKKSFQARLLKIMSIIFYINFSILTVLWLLQQNIFPYYQNIFSYDTLSEYDNTYHFKNFALFILIFFMTMIAIFLKKQSFLGMIYFFDDEKRYFVFVFNIDMFLNAVGLFLFPLTFLYVWGILNSEYFLHYLLISIVLLYFILLVISFLKVPQKTLIDYINFILYFCALEIIPLIVLSKLIRHE